MRYDVIVAGAGTAGLTAAVRAAQGGNRVLVLAKGQGATHLAPLTVDVLGYTPERVESPARELAGFVGAHPDHPYARTGTDAVGEALAWFAGVMEAGGYPYTGSLERNTLLPSAVGAARPSALVPVTMAGGDLRSDDPVCVVGLRPLKDFHAALLADNLGRQGVPARSVELDLEVDRVDQNALGLARAFDRPEVRSLVAAQLAVRLRPRERVAFPAVLGLRQAATVHRELEAQLGRRVFEVPTLPPSVPGLRVDRILVSALRAAGGRIIVGSEVVSASPGASGVTVRAKAAARDVEHSAGWLVLATGGFAEGSITLGADWIARETVLGLPLAHMPAPGEPRFVPDYFDDQPMSRTGVAVDAGLRPVGPDGARVHERVLVAGASIGGAVPWKEHSGEGISVTTGFRAAGEILAAMPAARVAA
jgi:glycerol-3-phosphate dehydrogenase subunit B